MFCIHLKKPTEFIKETKPMKIILASASPRRKEILTCLGRDFTVLSADADETCSFSDPAAYAKELAERKALAVAEKLKERGDLSSDTLIIAADTVVATDKEILGKPRDGEDAFRMLSLISGGEHSVITGVSIIYGDRMATDFCDTRVSVAHIPEEQIRKYVASGDPLDKAGAYGIQGEFSKWVIGIKGCYFNVVGLPTHTLNRLFYEVTGEHI